MNFRKLRAMILAALIPCPVLAAGSISGTVTSIRIDQSGNGMVFFDKNVSGTPPGCVISAYQNAFAFNTNTAGGKAIYAMVIAAKASGATIVAYGLGTCGTFGSYVEDWDTGVAY